MTDLIENTCGKCTVWNFVDRTSWSSGPWDQEPADKIVWEDSTTGFDCMIHRNGMGSWCGYVGVPKKHYLFGLDYNQLYEMGKGLDVHGGLTFSDACHNMDVNGKGICHPSDKGDHVWWFGFDCAHSGDRNPIGGPSDYGTYKDQLYVTNEVKGLAQQLSGE